MNTTDVRIIRKKEGGEKIDMKVRKLKPEEHVRTRPLWEEVFTEDTKAFLDYYYYIKTKDNEIYVVEEDDRICSMLQLNPYQLQIEKGRFPTAYIIAVATKETYRGRGFMGALLKRSLQDMYSAKIPFTFLMPAAEAIYTPYDFRFIYSQNIGTLKLRTAEGDNECTDKESSKKKYTGTELEHTGKAVFTDASLWEAEDMAEFFNGCFADRWQVYAVRDKAYYQTMIMEQQSEKGGVRLLREGGRLVGMYAYAAEDGLEVREPLFLPQYRDTFYLSLHELARSVYKELPMNQEIRVYACPDDMKEKEKPVIMARIVCLPEFLRTLCVPDELIVDCSFAVIDPIIRQNSRVWRIISRQGETNLEVRETEDSEGVLPVDVLTELLFGRIAEKDLSRLDGVIVTDHLTEELSKITKLTEIFLNEVV